MQTILPRVRFILSITFPSHNEQSTLSPCKRGKSLRVQAPPVPDTFRKRSQPSTIPLPSMAYPFSWRWGRRFLLPWLGDLGSGRSELIGRPRLPALLPIAVSATPPHTHSPTQRLEGR